MKQPLYELRDDQMAEALRLLKDADTVELKLTVPDTDHRPAISALDIEILNAELRQAVFFDTPDLKLHRRGIVIRARRIRGGGDSTIKLHPVVPSELPSSLRHSASFNVELDATPGAIVCSGSLKGKVNNSDVKLVLLDRQPIRKLFSPEQRALYKEHAPKGLTLDALTPFGPINIAKLKFSPAGFKRFLVAEMWFYPDGSRILELSTRCTPNKTFQILAETRAFLKQRGISLTGKQEMKTRRTLEYFSPRRKQRDGHARAA